MSDEPGGSQWEVPGASASFAASPRDVHRSLAAKRRASDPKGPWPRSRRSLELAAATRRSALRVDRKERLRVPAPPMPILAPGEAGHPFRRFQKEGMPGSPWHLQRFQKEAKLGSPRYLKRKRACNPLAPLKARNAWKSPAPRPHKGKQGLKSPAPHTRHTTKQSPELPATSPKANPNTPADRASLPASGSPPGSRAWPRGPGDARRSRPRRPRRFRPRC